eukprot:TRINITY_DN7726_c0_g1_i1.p1 TRINITY_DN7726_c0_g1~~TRINITY_DN7726_c0_g1_i1.p1  ORF type:complete len:373 (-),score=35.46 TRINITY_DN7726_c0_g1_i1:49-1167(-)
MSIPKYLTNLLTTGEDSDFSIFVFDDKGDKIEKKVHRIIIKQCPYFAAMLGLKGKEANDGYVTIDNITCSTLDHVLRYIYTEELLVVTLEQAIEIASAADYLQLAKLKAAALNEWRKLFLQIKSPEEIIEAFRKLVNASLPSPNPNIWREAMECVLVSMHTSTNFQVAEESSAFLELFIVFFGQQYPMLCTDLLEQWTKSNTTAPAEDRKAIAAKLIRKIKFDWLSLRTLALLSKSKALPADYMLEVIQKRAESEGQSVSDEVRYSITMKKNRIIELEHLTGYVLFWFKGFGQKIELWELLTVPEKITASVGLAWDDSSVSWGSGGMRKGVLSANQDFTGRISKATNKQIKVEIILTPKEGTKNRRVSYDVE